jgi:glycosyltransferase involved in cell wall biosynthesis
MGMYRPIDRNLWLKRLWHRLLGDRFLQDAAQIIATSEMERNELLNDGVGSQKLVVRYNGIDEDATASLPPRGSFRAKWRISPDEPLILFLGRLIPRKGADVLIDAFSQTCSEFGRLVIAGPEGEAGYLAYLEKHARESGAATRVLFTGPLYGEEKKAVLADADLFVLPSRYENFANSAAEAIACGVPVIVTESCGICSLVDGRAGLVIAPERNALAAALCRLLSDRPLYARLKEGCSEVARQLSWERLTEQMEGYYMDVLARRNGIN